MAGFLSKTLNRARKGMIEVFFDNQSEVKSYSIREVDKKEDSKKIVDIEGSIEIYPSMLSNGKLDFKIGKLTGDFISYCRELNPSILPEEIGGNIIFRNHLLGTNIITTKFGIGDYITFIDKNSVERIRVNSIKCRIFYTDQMSIEKEVFYTNRLNTVKESDAFSSNEELKNSILGINNDTGDFKRGYQHKIKYSVGDQVWFFKDGKICCNTITEVEIEVKKEINKDKSSKDESESVPELITSVIYKVSIDDSNYNFIETQLFDSKKAIASEVYRY